MRKMVTTEVVISLDDLAEEFVNECDDYQAAFFNVVGHKFKEVEWPANFQLDSIAELLDDDGKSLIIALADRVIS